MPDFLRYFLNANDITHGGESGGVFRAEMISIGGALYPPIDNSISGVLISILVLICITAVLIAVFYGVNNKTFFNKALFQNEQEAIRLIKKNS